MIKYTLKCAQGHEFEAWFGRIADFDEQAKKHMIECPDCGNQSIEKAPMAPSVHGAQTKRSGAAASLLRAEIAKNCENVGNDFADEARAMFYGEKRGRGIYGRASLSDVKDLSEEGISTIPLPDVLVPKTKKKLN